MKKNDESTRERLPFENDRREEKGAETYCPQERAEAREDGDARLDFAADRRRREGAEEAVGVGERRAEVH